MAMFKAAHSGFPWYASLDGETWVPWSDEPVAGDEASVKTIIQGQSAPPSGWAVRTHIGSKFLGSKQLGSRTRLWLEQRGFTISKV
jgi:hypothetical protein